MSDVVMYRRGQIPIDKRLEPILQSILADDTQVKLAKQIRLLEQLNRHWEKTEFEGKIDCLIMSVTDQEMLEKLLYRFPHKSWITCSFINQGPDTAYVIINRWPLQIADWVPVFKGVPFEINFAGSDKRIELIRHKCDIGKTASVVAIGKY